MDGKLHPGLFRRHTDTDPLKDLGVSDTDVAKVLFLCAKPDHEAHNDAMGDTGSCNICRLVAKFREAILKKSLVPLKRELKVKTLKLSQHDMPDQVKMSTLESNFSDIDDELDTEDEELLTFTEVLDLMQIPIPITLQVKLQILLTKKRIPVRQSSADRKGAAHTTKHNTFLAYTINKKISEICDTLKPEDVFAMKEFTLKQEDIDQAVIKMAKSLSDVDDLEAIKSISGMKDVVFYYIILNMYKESLLNRLYTHVLEFILKGASTSLPNAASRLHIELPIDLAINSLRRYPLTPNPPGICIILAMTKDRLGSVHDVYNVRKVFEEEFNYDVFEKLNPTSKDLKSLVTKLSASRNMFYDSLVVWVMAHGDKTNLLFKDGEIHRRMDLLQPFVDIEWLNKKPKLFFIQACATKRSRICLVAGAGLKGDIDSASLGINQSEDWKKMYSQHMDPVVVNSFADTLVSYATMWYHEASRNEKGSLYINTLLDCMTKRGRKISIEGVLRDMHYSVNTVTLEGDEEIWKQTPYYESSLQKEFIFP